MAKAQCFYTEHVLLATYIQVNAKRSRPPSCQLQDGVHSLNSAVPLRKKLKLERQMEF